MRISDWSSDVCSSDLRVLPAQQGRAGGTAEGVGDEIVLEGHALVLDQSLRLRHESVARHILVVGEDEYDVRSEEHTSELQSLMRISYDVFCLKQIKNHTESHLNHNNPD